MARFRQLPPLNSLVHFEAAARLGSFTRAADELNVTQGAVSRQVKRLEGCLGCDLFVRHGRRIMLTDEGHNYHVSIADLLNQLAASTRDIQEDPKAGQVTLATSSALATFYLLPRIPAFRRAHEDIRIRVIARDELSDGPARNVDLALYYLRKPPPGDPVLPLFREEVFPVCSPEYLAENRGRFGTPAWYARDLIWLESDEDWINWPEWLSRVNLPADTLQNRFVVNHYSMVIQAAVAGQGIGLGWAGLVDDELSRGTLVRPVDISLCTDAGFYLLPASGRQPKPRAQVFRQWLLQQGK